MKRILLALLACLAPTVARAQTIDLTTSSASITGADGVRWTQGSSFSLSVGATPFLRIQATGSETGFNTDFRPLPPDAIGTTATHSITFASFRPRIQTDATGAHRYQTFLVDVNESSLASDNYLSLDSLIVYSVPAASGGALATRAAIAAAGVPRYNMDAPTNQTVLLDGNLVVGSGLPDLQIDIPASQFDGVASDDFIYMILSYGKVGLVSGRNYGSSDGFEELFVLSQSSVGVETEAPGPTPWIRAIGGPSYERARFRYYVPRSGGVRLSLYDVRGRLVASRSSSGDGGVKDVPLAQLLGARPIGSGVYFYTLDWDGIRRSGRLAILR